MVLGVKKLWIFPLAIPAVMVALVATIYIGTAVNPTGHLHDLPVLIVDQDTGATTPNGHVDFGQSLVQASLGSKEVTTYLDLQVLSVAQAEKEMDDRVVYATLVIPSTLSASGLLAAGYPSGVAMPAQAAVHLLENGRLAAGVLTPALGQFSKQMGARLTAESTSAVRSNPVLADNLSDPVVLSVVSYRPLPSHSALGLSAFYVSLLAISAGFLAATAIDSSVDGALGYATSDLGPR
jgi:YhgE/Pip-like protein